MGEEVNHGVEDPTDVEILPFSRESRSWEAAASTTSSRIEEGKRAPSCNASMEVALFEGGSDEDEKEGRSWPVVVVLVIILLAEPFPSS